MEIFLKGKMITMPLTQSPSPQRKAFLMLSYDSIQKKKKYAYIHKYLE